MAVAALFLSATIVTTGLVAMLDGRHTVRAWLVLTAGVAFAVAALVELAGLRT